MRFPILGVCILVGGLVIIVAVIISLLPLSLSFIAHLCVFFFARTVLRLTVHEKMYSMDSTMDMMYTYDRIDEYEQKLRNGTFLLFILKL